MGAAARVSASASSDSDPVDKVFECLVNIMKEDQYKIWNSVELHGIF